MSLIPGAKQTWNKLKISVLTLSLPTLPMLANLFATENKKIMIKLTDSPYLKETF